jgi:hypothetical protein
MENLSVIQEKVKENQGKARREGKPDSKLICEG